MNNTPPMTRTPWHQWFAWRPVFTDDRGWVWLRRVWRRHVPPMDFLIPNVNAPWTWDYSVTDQREN